MCAFSSHTFIIRLWTSFVYSICLYFFVLWNFIRCGLQNTYCFATSYIFILFPLEIKKFCSVLFCSVNFRSPLISAHCVQISAQKLHFLWRNKKKTVFEKNAFLWKIAIFHENGQNFGRYLKKVVFFGVFIIHSIIPSISVIFSSIAIILVELWAKKYKN